MIYPLSSHNEIITDASGEVVASVEPGPFGQGRLTAAELVALANLGYRTKQHQEELENLSALKGEACHAFAPSVMVEFTAEEFANFQTGLGALRQLSRRTETPEEKKVEPASTDIAEGWNPYKLTKAEVGYGWELLNYGDDQRSDDEFWCGKWEINYPFCVGEKIHSGSVPHRRRIIS